MLEEAKLIALKKELIAFATLVEDMLTKSMEGLRQRQEDILHEVIEISEPQANDFEIAMDEMCVSIIAQHQPAGKSLRTILMALNIGITLERMADHCVSSSKCGLYLIAHPPVKALIDLPEMSEIVRGMVKDSIHSFVNEDADLARSVCERDNAVDELRSRIVRDLIGYMTRDSATVERSLQLLKIAGNLERTADLSTNICEDVIYMVRGKIIKHHRDTP